MEQRMPGVLEGKVAIVTGAGRGIGRGIAVEFAREGARVAVASRSLPSIEETLAEIRALGGEAIGIRCDVGDPGAIARTTAETAEAFGRIDILVNNAQSFGSAEKPAPTPVLTPLETFDDGEWERTFATGPTATYHFMKATFPFLKASGAGRIINFGSYWGQIGYEGSAAYNAAKEAIRGLTRTAAREWGQHGITANVINPAIASDALKTFVREHRDTAEQSMQSIPMRRYGDIYKDGGRLAVFLAGDDAAFLTGMTFQADGGLFMSP
jgi:NAD(P)-dependent dehydrogenase (short-subunit alcohol dehydrogenase family)